jgi:hypothetical protein
VSLVAANLETRSGPSKGKMINPVAGG